MTVYSMIGVQCILLGGILFPPIYWQTACLLQRSGALDGKSADYNKIAKAVSILLKQGVNIAPVNINKSENNFILDKDTNTIYYGLSGVKGLKAKTIEQIFAKRPFKSMFDFIVKTNADISSIVTLVKAGAFDEFGTRAWHIEALSKFEADQKQQLNGQNLAMIARNGLWPQDTQELIDSFHCYNFTQYLKLITKENQENNADFDTDYYYLDERAKDYLDGIDYDYKGNDYLLKISWKAYYDLMIQPIKRYLADQQEEILAQVNSTAIQAWKEKYFPSEESEAQWEIATLGVCFKEHPMSNLINISNFEDLSSEPEIASFFNVKGRYIPLYKLTMIAGIVIAKDKMHSTITLLTSTGPVEVKMRKEVFSHYDAQISQKINNGKKKVIEKSWLNRGIGLIVHGMRQNDAFVAKTYKNSPMKHVTYKVLTILPTGKVTVQKERKSGIEEETQDE